VVAVITRAGAGNVVAVETFAALALPKKPAFRCSGDVEGYVNLFPSLWLRRFIAAIKSGRVSGPGPDLDSSQILPVVESSNGALDSVRTSIRDTRSPSPACPPSPRVNSASNERKASIAG